MSTGQHRAIIGDGLPQVFGRYLLLKRLSRGGMGEIFLGRHGLSGFEKLVVIKKVLPHLAEDEQFISRFIDEAQVAIKLQHAHIAQVFEVGRVEDEYFLSLEYVEGRDLRRTLAHLDDEGTRMPIDLALMIARDVAGGLSYAHRRTDDAGNSLELVHCDISPPNVMVSFEGETKIIDFGIAKSAMRGTSTDPKMGFGKFGYMAPEQLIRGGKVDSRTDIYANGVILFELLTGQRMYEMGESPDYRALARMVAKGQHPLPSHVDAGLEPYDEIVTTALRPDPGDRYQTAAELRDAIQHALVKVNPTASPENLGGYMRDLFEEELGEERQAIAQAEATDMAPWVIEMTTQSATTVSYAVANMPLVAEPEQTFAPAIRPTRGAPSHAAGEIGHTEIVGRQRLPVHRPRRGVAIALAVGAMLLSGTVLAWVLSRDDGTPAVAASPAAADDEAGERLAAASADEVEPLAMPPEPIVTGQLPADSTAVGEVDDDEELDGPPLAARTESRKKLRPYNKKPPKKRRPTARPRASSAEATVSRSEVEARFSKVWSEYKTFRQSYGARLEKEWADLATFATYAKADDDKLRTLDRRIKHFRARMSKARQ